MNASTPLRDFANRRLVVLHERDSGYAAARALKDNGIGCVLVANANGKLSGIVTDRDLVLRCICEGIDPGSVELRYLMTVSPAAVDEEQTVGDALWVMRSLGVRRVPIVSAQGKPVGVVSFDDLVGRVEQPAPLHEVIERQEMRQSRYNPEGVSAGKRGAGPSAYSISPEDFHEAIEEAPASLHQARVEQSMGRLLGLARQCLEEHGVFALDRDEIRAGLSSFLSCIVRRVVPGAAGNLIDQLPKLIQEDLYSEPAGPDTSIDSEVLERVVRKRLRLRGELARPATEALAETIVLSVSAGEVKALCMQLPGGLRELFEVPMREGQDALKVS